MMKRKGEFTYDIFLSFNGKDTRKCFTDHVYSALTRRGIKTFRDDKSLERGEDFEPELFRAIRESWGSIIVMSETYAFSRWCLDELVEIMKQRKQRGHEVYPVFYKVKSSDFRHQINNVKEAFDKHEIDKRYDGVTMLGWRVALKEVTGIHGWSLKDQYESVFIEDIVKDISKKMDTEILDDKEVETMKSNFRMIQDCLVYAENKQDAKEGEAVKVWLDKLKHIAYDMDDVLDEWNTAILKSKIEKDQAQTPSISSSSLSEVQHSLGGRGASFSGLTDLNLPPPESDIPSTFFHSSGIALCHDIALRIKELNQKCQPFIKDLIPFPLGLNSSCTDFRLERPKTERPKAVSLIDESVVYGRDHDKDALIHLLLSDGNSEGGTCNGIPLLAIVGMGGIGKTTLAQLAYNNDEVKDHFPLRIWVCVSNPFDEVRIAKAILESLDKGSSSSFNELESLLQEIHQKIEGEKFLLILDDVWTEDENKWEPLKLSLRVGSQESKILVTTRNEKVASILGCVRPFLLGVLSNEDSWSLFSKIAFSGRSYQDRESLESVGRKFVEKCAGLPLAIKTLASLLRFKRCREQWQRILDSQMWELDEAEKGPFSALLLSYNDLSLPLRQCFSYCAIFPKDYVIEKEMLIKLWMAQGFLRETQVNEMENVGEEYFESLAIRSFFQEFEKDEDDDTIIIRCKMHDIVHDFAQFLRKTECCVVASGGTEEQIADSCHENIRHLTLTCGDDDMGIPDSTYKVKKLRSLLIDSFYNTSTLEASLPKLFDGLTCLRMLDLSEGSIKELRQEIGKLIHLRYLSLKGNKLLFELPEALCDLCNLQTLNIRDCRSLRKLPLGMGKLINLRHLQNQGTSMLTFMPKGMRRLTCLHTLEWIVVGKEGGFRLADLGKLIHLRGQLVIKGLGYVKEASEAREARLSAKAGLRELTLGFFPGQSIEIEDLQPPQQLQILRIWFLEGSVFPNWMTSLTSLKSVELGCCNQWESLPPMGKLPSLESLLIEELEMVKKVGEEFLGVEKSSSSFSLNHNASAFPNLRKLRFERMYGWKEWEYDEKILRSRGDDSSSSTSSNITVIMPKLQSLSIKYCKKLKTLPHHLLQSGALQELVIKGSRNLYRRFNKETGDEWSSICHIPEVEIWEPDNEDDEDSDSNTADDEDPDSEVADNEDSDSEVANILLSLSKS